MDVTGADAAAPNDRTDHRLRSVAFGLLAARAAAGLHRYRRFGRLAPDERDAVETFASVLDFDRSTSGVSALTTGSLPSMALAGATLSACEAATSEGREYGPDDPANADSLRAIVSELHRVLSGESDDNDYLEMLERVFRHLSDFIGKQYRSPGETLNAGLGLVA